MNQLAKRSLALVTALAVAGGAGFGGWRLYRNRRSSAVNVYDSNELVNRYWQEDTQTDGIVSTDQFQAEYLSDTQTVNEIQVKPGQTVKKGDILFTYDSTLTEIDLQRKDIEVQKKHLELNDARRELNKIRRYKPGKPIPGSSHSYTIPGTSFPAEPIPVYEGLELLSGDGTRELPFCYLWKDNFLLNDTLIAAAMQGKTDCFVCFDLGGKDVSFPEPEPDPEPEPEPQPEPKPDHSHGDESTTDKPSGDKSDPEQKEKPDQEDHSSPEPAPGDSSHKDGDSSGSQSDSSAPADPGDGSESGSSSTPGAEAGDTALLSASECALSVQDLFLLSATEEDPGTGETPEKEDGSESRSDSSQTGEEDPYSAAWVYHCQHTVSGYRYVPVSMSVGGVERTVMEPLPPMTDEENPEKQKKTKPQKVKDPGIVYTRAQLASMRQEQETIVRDCTLELKQMEVERQKLERELNHSAVYSALDGVVLELNDPKELEDSQPVLKVSGGGGYLIRGSISELSLDSVRPGQTVTISDWSSGESYEGTVQSVSDYPTANGGWSDGNNNVSYYSFSVRVDASANLEENNYVQLSYSQGGNEDTNSAYLLNSFIRSEGAKSYILYEQDGKLVKQYVRTGKSVWGMYTELIGGLEPDLYLAFPYGKNVREGAPTQRAGIDVLYGYGG